MLKKKKTATRLAPPRVKLIRYFCDGTCTAKPKHLTGLKRNDIVVMVAINTDATINFTSGSPFKSGTAAFTISQMTAQVEVVAKKGQHFYSLACSGCPSPIDDPSMIVDP